MPRQMGLLRQRHRKTSTATTTDHYGRYVGDGERWYIAVLAFSCGTTDNADVVIAIDCRGYDHVITSQINMIHAEWYTYRPQLWLEEGERLKFSWDGIVDGEVVEVHVTGHIHYVTCELEGE